MSEHDHEDEEPRRDYEVGYGKPPRAGQFKPGQSGNPRGRPKGSRSLEEEVQRECDRLIRVKIGDKVEHITRKQALARQLVARALSNDMAAIRVLLPLLAAAGDEGSAAQGSPTDDDPGPAPAGEPDEAAIARMLARFAHRGGGAGS